MNPHDLTGRTAVITGSSRNLGLAMARAMASRGANLVFNAHSSQDEVDAAVAEFEDAGTPSVGILADVSTPEGVQHLSDLAHEAFGDVHILVNNAAIRPHTAFDDLDLEGWRAIMAVNLDAAFLCSRAFLPDMVRAGWGRIINISGIDAYWGKTGKAHLVTANLGLVGLARSLAVEYATKGITVNAVIPGAMDTTRPHAKDFYPGYVDRYETMFNRVPMGRAGKPEELAEVVAFLASPAASYVTAQEIHVNGGAYPTQADSLADPVVPPGTTFRIDDSGVVTRVGPAGDAERVGGAE